jgi:hypothetical protein
LSGSNANSFGLGRMMPSFILPWTYFKSTLEQIVNRHLFRIGFFAALIISKQGDQVRFWKDRPKCSPALFCENHVIREKKYPKHWATSVIKNYPTQTIAQKAKIRPIWSPCFQKLKLGSCWACCSTCDCCCHTPPSL